MTRIVWMAIGLILIGSAWQAHAVTPGTAAILAVVAVALLLGISRLMRLVLGLVMMARALAG